MKEDRRILNPKWIKKELQAIVILKYGCESRPCQKASICNNII